MCLLSHTLPLGGMASSRCRRQATAAKKKGGGEICACFRTPTPLIAEEIPHPWHFDPLTVISPSPRKSPGAADPAPASEVRTKDGESEAGRGSSEKGGGSGQFDPLTVISLSTRKSPGAAGALSLSPYGVSDPAASSGPRPSEAIPPVAKQGGDAKRGEGEARKAGEADSYLLDFPLLNFSFFHDC